MQASISRDHSDRLHQMVADRWPEIAALALRECADGYNRGYVLLPGDQGRPSYVPIPDQKRSSSERQPPYTLLEHAVLATENCEDFIVVALKAGDGLTWSTFSEVQGTTLREAAGINPRRK